MVKFVKKLLGTFFSDMWSVIKGGTGGPDFLVGLISNRRGNLNLLDLLGDPQFLPLVVHPNFPTRKPLRRVLGFAYCNNFENSEL